MTGSDQPQVNCTADENGTVRCEYGDEEVEMEELTHGRLPGVDDEACAGQAEAMMEARMMAEAAEDPEDLRKVEQQLQSAMLRSGCPIPAELPEDEVEPSEERLRRAHRQLNENKEKVNETVPAYLSAYDPFYEEYAREEFEKSSFQNDVNEAQMGIEKELAAMGGDTPDREPVRSSRGTVVCLGTDEQKQECLHRFNENEEDVRGYVPEPSGNYGNDEDS